MVLRNERAEVPGSMQHGFLFTSSNSMQFGISHGLPFSDPTGRKYGLQREGLLLTAH